nr:hypothetical protein [Morchella crassipes]
MGSAPPLIIDERVLGDPPPFQGSPWEGGGAASPSPANIFASNAGDEERAMGALDPVLAPSLLLLSFDPVLPPPRRGGDANEKEGGVHVKDLAALPKGPALLSPPILFFSYPYSLSRVRFLYLGFRRVTYDEEHLLRDIPPLSRSPLFITTTCVIVWKGGGVAPLFISWFFPPPGGAGSGGKGKKFKNENLWREGGGDFLNLSSWVPKGYPRGEGCPVTPPYLW